MLHFKKGAKIVALSFLFSNAAVQAMDDSAYSANNKANDVGPKTFKVATGLNQEAFMDMMNALPQNKHGQDVMSNTLGEAVKFNKLAYVMLIANNMFPVKPDAETMQHAFSIAIGANNQKAFQYLLEGTATSPNQDLIVALACTAIEYNALGILEYTLTYGKAKKLYNKKAWNIIYTTFASASTLTPEAQRAIDTVLMRAYIK
jgi:hypothetical protein